MARDDYHVIVYQILAYLYQCLKTGSDVDPEVLKYDSPLVRAGNERYWNYIMWNLHTSGMVTGINFVKVDNLATPYPADMSGCMITPAGIEYLCDNSFLKKARQFLKDAKEITPFI